MPTKPLADRIAVVAGATRGAGRGIARMLGEAGATVYCTGRSTTGAPSPIGRRETIEETAAMVDQEGGVGIPVVTDYSDAGSVEELFERVSQDQSGRLDVLVNDIGGEDLAEWNAIEDVDLDRGFAFLETAVHTHIVASRYAVPLMREQGHGLIVEVTDGDHSGYRGALFYDLAKTQVMRLAFALGRELRHRNIAVVAVTPGFLRSEAMLDNFGVTEDNWQDANERAKGFCESETPSFLGRGVAALAADPAIIEKTGRTFASWNLAKEYGFDDIDGRRPDWMGYVVQSIEEILARGGPVDREERFWLRMWHDSFRDEPGHSALRERIAGIVDVWD